MPQLQNLILTDRAGTPVAHTFVPRDIVGNVGTVVESSSVPVGNNRFSISLRQTQPGGRYKATIQLAMPVVATQVVNGISTPVVARTAYADLTFTFEATSTLQERKDIVGMLMTALDPSKTLVNDVVTALQGVY